MSSVVLAAGPLMHGDVPLGEAISFWILGPVALAGGIGLVTLRNAVHCPLSLAATMMCLGAMYVIEGSTLGGQLIGRHVERVLGLTAGQGNAYFRGHNERTGQLWKEFCDALRTKVPDRETDTVIAAAKTMFGVFWSWMRIASK